MVEPIDAFFKQSIAGLSASEPTPRRNGHIAPDMVLALFDAQIQSRHLDFAARWLQSQGQGFYTIASAGHEANAAMGMVTRVDDPALLHYRSGGFYAARAALHAAAVENSDEGVATDPIRDVLRSLTTAAADPISGGRHKVFGHPALHIIPQTSTIASHLPRAVGLSFALGSLRERALEPPWPSDAIVVCSLGDASVNHSTAQGAFNAAGYLKHRKLAAPILFVCEDNGIGISTPTPAEWTRRTLQRLPGVTYFQADDPDPALLITAAREATNFVRTAREPAVLHLHTVRFMGHAGSDAELAYRTATEIAADYARDPLLASARYLVSHRILQPWEILERYELMRHRVMDQARSVVAEPRLNDRATLMRPIAAPRPRSASVSGSGSGEARAPSEQSQIRRAAWQGKVPESEGALTLAQTINATLADLLIEYPQTIVFGEDVAVKGGVYGVTRGLRKRFGGSRVFDTLLDEQTILGTALGAGLAGLLPIPEIQYLAYLHNAEDQLRGEGASLQFFSQEQYRNPMVARIAGLAYQKGFGGHFHNDNSIAVLRDVPGMVVCVPSHPSDAPLLLRECARLALHEGRVCVYLEPIALYHTRDLFDAGDGAWTAPYSPPGATDASPAERAPLGTARTYDDGPDLLIVTFGNGLPMSRRAARRLSADGIGTTVLDLRWLAPLPVDALLEQARRFDRVLIVDETRRSGGVAEALLAALVDAGYDGAMARVTSHDSFIPLGPSAQYVLLQEDDIIAAARCLSEKASPSAR